MPTRAWELLFGSVPFFYEPKLGQVARRILEAVGFGLIFLSFIILSENSGMHILALMPVMGTVSILLANRPNSILTGNLVCQRLGSASYSIYLWHWPVTVYFGKAGLVSVHLMFVQIFISIVLGFLSFKFVENGLRFARHGFFDLIRPKGIVISVILVLTLIFNFGAILSDGFSERFASRGSVGPVLPESDAMNREVPFDVNEILKIKNVWSHFSVSREWRIDECHGHSIDIALSALMKNCVEQNGRIVFLWGDSFAAALYPGLRDYQELHSGEFSIGQFTDGNGQPYFDKAGTTSTNITLLEINRKKIDAVRCCRPLSFGQSLPV